MEIKANCKEGYELLHSGAIEFARVEENGIRINVDRLAKTKEKLHGRIREITNEIEADDIWKIWRKCFGAKANITSRDQLAVVLFDKMGFQVTDRTEGGKPSTDEEALQKVDHPAIPKLLRLVKYEKALGTYLKGIEREIIGDRIHPVLNLHFVRTYRSSCDSPNFQNIPVRDKEIAKIVRSLFIASENSVLVENDFKGIEVALSAAYHHDPNFISYITTPGKDMHRDIAAQIYMLEPEEVSKEARYGAKNKFVFPQFYGDFYVACARNMWEWIDKGKLTGPDGESLKEHLKQQGIKKLGACDPESKPVKGTFEFHMREVEQDFWNNRFRVYGQWRKDWFSEYQENGYFDMLSGFRVYGTFSRNQVTNAPIQGSAFHCLLWSLIQVNRRLRKHKLRSKVVGQIHDSLIGDVLIDELSDYLGIVEQITTVELKEHYDWLVVPPEIEYEIAPVGRSWHDKREMKFQKGKFFHPDKPDKFTTDAGKFLETIGQRHG